MTMQAACSGTQAHGRFGQLENSFQARPQLIVVGTTSLVATPRKETSKCFLGPRYHAVRDNNIDTALLAVQHEAPACVVTTLGPEKSTQYVERPVVLPGITADTTNLELLSTQLRAKGYPFKSLVQLEEIIAAIERGEKTGIRTDGWGNLGFVENKEGSISIIEMRYYGSLVRPRIRRLGRGVLISPELRLMVCNWAT